MTLRLGRCPREVSAGMAQSLNEGFTLVASASSADELRRVTPTISIIDEGRRGRTIIESPVWAPIGPLADLAGAETIFRRVFVPEGIEIIDVHGEGLTTAVIDWRVSRTFQAAQGQAAMELPILIPVILGLIVVALLATGWVVRSISVFVETVDEAFGGALPWIVGGIVAIAGVAVLSGQKRGSTTNKSLA